MIEFIKRGRRFINKETALLLLFALLVLYVPCHYRYHKLLHHFSKKLLAFPGAFPMFFEKMVYYSISDVLIILFAFLCFVFRKVSFSKLVSTSYSKALLLFFALALISLSMSKHHFFGLQYYRLLQLFICSLVFYLLAEVDLQASTRSLVKIFATCTFFISLLQSVVAIRQYFSQKAVGLKRLGELSLSDPGVNPSSIISTDGSLWLFDHLSAPGIGRKLIRAFGTLPDPNILGGFMALAILATLYLYFHHGARYKVLFFAALFLEVFTLTISFSRSAFFAALLTSGVYLFFKYRQITKKRQSAPMGQVLACLISSFALSLLLFYPQLLSRGGYVNYSQTAAHFADTERVCYQKIAFAMIEKHPLLGVGFNNYILDMKQYAEGALPAEYSHPVHNIFMLIGAETGLLGLGFFSFVFFGLAFSLFKGELTEERIFLFSAVFMVFFIGICSHYYLSWQSGRLMLFTIFGLIARIRRQCDTCIL